MIKTLSITEARNTLPHLVSGVQKKLDEYVITVNGSPVAVLMSAKEYESWKETTDIISDPGLMKAIAQGEKEIKDGKYVTLEELEKELGL